MAYNNFANKILQEMRNCMPTRALGMSCLLMLYSGILQRLGMQILQRFRNTVLQLWRIVYFRVDIDQMRQMLCLRHKLIMLQVLFIFILGDKQEIFQKSRGYLVNTGALHILRTAKIRAYCIKTKIEAAQIVLLVNVPPIRNNLIASQKKCIAFYSGKDSEEEKILIEVMSKHFQSLKTWVPLLHIAESTARVKELKLSKRFSKEDIEVMLKHIQMSLYLVLKDNPMPTCKL